jgi:heme exporter protein D
MVLPMYEFLNMGGYAFYVWSAYGISLVVLIINAVIPSLREKKIIHLLSKRKKRFQKA